MRDRSTISQHWPALLVVGLIALAGLGVWVLQPGSLVRSTANFVLVALPVSISVAQYLYLRVDRWNLWINSIALRISNPDVRLQVTATFAGLDAQRVFKEVSAEIENRASEPTKALGRTHDGQIWTWAGKTLRLRSTIESDPINGERDVVRFDMPDASLSYRTAQLVLEGELGSLLCDLDQVVTSDERRFAMSVTFDRDNPYFGAFVRSSSSTSVSEFRMTILEPEPSGLQEDVVSIRQDRLKFVTGKAHSLQRLGLKYLRLRPS